MIVNGSGYHKLTDTTREVDNSCAGKVCFFFPNCRGAGAANCYRRGKCTTCGWTHSIYLCSRHEAGFGSSFVFDCYDCDGTGRVTDSKPCVHGYYYSHDCCAHDYTYQHDTD